MMFLAALFFLAVYAVLISISAARSTSYRTHLRLNKVALLVLVVSGILLGSAISGAWL